MERSCQAVLRSYKRKETAHAHPFSCNGRMRGREVAQEQLRQKDSITFSIHEWRYTLPMNNNKQAEVFHKIASNANLLKKPALAKLFQSVLQFFSPLCPSDSCLGELALVLSSVSVWWRLIGTRICKHAGN